jgi:hypothetical protein
MRLLHSLLNGLGRVVPAFGDEDTTQLLGLAALGVTYLHFSRGFLRDVLDLGRTITDALFYYLGAVGIVSFHRLYLLTNTEVVQELKRGSTTDGVVDPVNQAMVPGSMLEVILSWFKWGFGTVTYPISTLIGIGSVTIVYAAISVSAVHALHHAFPDVVLVTTLHKLTSGITSEAVKVINKMLGSTFTFNQDSGDVDTDSKEPRTPKRVRPPSVSVTDNMTAETRSSRDELNKLARTVSDINITLKASTADTQGRLMTLTQEVENIKTGLEDRLVYLEQTQAYVEENDQAPM